MIKDKFNLRKCHAKPSYAPKQYCFLTHVVYGMFEQGFVKSPISATLPQISARLFFTWGIMWSFPEIIRYSFFGLKETFGVIPSWLLWLRYSSFMIFVPIALVSELGLIYAALPYMKASEKFCLRMPNKWNFSFYYFYASVLLTILYIPGGPYMFRYMLGKRRKVLSKAKLI